MAASVDEVRRAPLQLHADDARRLGLGSIAGLLRPGDATALCSADGRSDLSHSRLRSFLRQLDLASFGICRGRRVGCAVPNAPEAATVCLALSHLHRQVMIGREQSNNPTK